MSIEQPGLVKIETGGSASTTTIEIDGVVPMVERAVIIIDSHVGHNLIKLHCFSRQNNKIVKGGTQTFCGISEENFEFMKGLLFLLSKVSDEALLDATPSNGIPNDIVNVLTHIHNARGR